MTMRILHRWIGIVAAILLAYVALTGMALQLEMVLDGGGGAPGTAGPPGAMAAGSVSLFLQNAATALRAHPPEGKVVAVHLSRSGSVPAVEIDYSRSDVPPLRINARTGKVLNAGAASAAPGRDLHLLLLTLHRGDIAGMGGQIVSLLCGAALFLLCATGIVVYARMLIGRIRMGRRALFWT